MSPDQKREGLNIYGEGADIAYLIGLVSNLESTSKKISEEIKRIKEIRKTRLLSEIELHELQFLQEELLEVREQETEARTELENAPDKRQ